MARSPIDALFDVGTLVGGGGDLGVAAARVLDLDALGIDVLERHFLGRGAFNRVHSCLLRPRDGTASRRVAIKRVKAQLFNGGPTTVQVGVGIDHGAPRLAQRNVATSLLDGFLGTASAPRAAIVLIEKQTYVAMTIAPGVGITRQYQQDPQIILDPAFQRRCSDLEMLAFLAGHPDVHCGNILVSARDRGGPGADIQITLIDNDLSFGPHVDNPDQMPNLAESDARQYRHTGLPAYVDLNTASRLRSMDRRAIVEALESLLTPRELTAFEARLDLARAHIAWLKDINRIVADWARFVNVRDDPLDGGDLIAGTLDLAGVVQGGKKASRCFAPRSLIVRDCLDGRLGTGADLDAALGAERSALLNGWARSAKTHVPPSGINHR